MCNLLIQSFAKEFSTSPGRFWILYFKYEQDYITIDFAKFAIICHFIRQFLKIVTNYSKIVYYCYEAKGRS